MLKTLYYYENRRISLLFSILGSSIRDLLLALIKVLSWVRLSKWN